MSDHDPAQEQDPTLERRPSGDPEAEPLTRDGSDGPPLADPPAPLATVAPTAPGQREPVLDVLRGFALLGILLVNIEYMRGAEFYRLLAGVELPTAPLADRVTEFAIGWLATGKFISSFAIMFGVGAALIAARARRGNRSPRRLLARRYGLLVVLGLAHMVLLFPGDILFLYGITGLALLAFVGVRARTAMWWAAGLLVFITVASTATMLLMPSADPSDPAVASMVEAYQDLGEQSVAAHTDGSYGEVIAVNAMTSSFLQIGQFVLLPWVLALFLFGFAVARAGVLDDLRSHQRRLRTAAIVGLGVGLPANLVLGIAGPMALATSFSAGDETGAGLLAAAMFVQLVGAPVLAIGYLASVALLALRWGPSRHLASVGRMALTAYLAQSALALTVFAGLGLYDQLSTVESMLVVVGIWAVLLLACPAWMRRFRFGPVEWAWRTATYGKRQPMRAER